MIQRYPGDELELFARAANWKAYLASQLSPHLKGDVLEVGAGIGASTAAFCDGSASRWVCLEPDPEFAKQIEARVAAGELPRCCSVVCGSVHDLAEGARFDAVTYIDVLEHILEDADELTRVADLLRPGGVLIVLSPAHPWLFSPFDAAIGHHRRYTKQSLSAVVPRGLECVKLCYLDSAGLLASAGNRALLRRSLPSAGNIAFWDGVLVPLSRWIDPVLGYRAGRSVLGIWRAARG
jgi:SAM-dependent methyltransferase